MEPVKPKQTFDEWFATVPSQKKDTANYRLRYAYDNNLIPQEELTAFATDKDAHLRSAYHNPKTGNYDFIKSRNHDTVNMELDWYKGDTPDAVQFRKEYKLKDDGSDFYEYTKNKRYGSTVEPLKKDNTNVMPRFKDGVSSFKQDSDTLFVNNPDDKRLKQYNDSLTVYNATNKNFVNQSNNYGKDKDFTKSKLYASWDEAAKKRYNDWKEKEIASESDPLPTVGPYGSKIEYSYTKDRKYNEPGNSKKSQLEIDYPKIKPSKYGNVSQYGEPSIYGVWNHDYKTTLPPNTAKVENNTDAKELKKAYPLITKQNIDSLYNDAVSNNKNTKMALYKVPYGSGYELNYPDPKSKIKSERVGNTLEAIENKTPKNVGYSYPIYKKPVVPVVYKSQNQTAPIAKTADKPTISDSYGTYVDRVGRIVPSLQSEYNKLIKGTDIGGEFESQGYVDQMPVGFLNKKQFRPLK